MGRSSTALEFESITDLWDTLETSADLSPPLHHRMPAKSGRLLRTWEIGFYLKWVGGTVRKGFNTSRGVQIMFQIDLAIEHHCFTGPNIQNLSTHDFHINRHLQPPLLSSSTLRLFQGFLDTPPSFVLSLSKNFSEKTKSGPLPDLVSEKIEIHC